MSFRLVMQPLMTTIFAIALVLDAVYQFITVRWYYPGEALVTAATLAFVPYILPRGPVNRVMPGKPGRG